MKTFNIRTLSAALLTSLWVVSAFAQLTPMGDAYTNSANPTTNFGAKNLLDVQSASQTTYIQFDLSSIPAGYTGSNIAKATLKLYVNTVPTAGSFNVDFVNGTWAEKTITSNMAPALGSTIAASIPVSSTNVKDYILVDITSALQAWLNGTQANDGIALVANSPLNATLDSKETTTQSHPPELDVVFTSSGGGGITGITTVGGSGLIGGGDSGTLNLSLTHSCANNQVLQWNGTSWVCANPSGSGTVTSVGLSAPASDLTVSGSPVKTSGTLGLSWTVAPTSGNTANAIVKRNGTGSFNANTIATTGPILTTTAGNVGVFAIANATMGQTIGVNGVSESASDNATGVLGLATDSAGIGHTYGVVGVSNSPFGVGVFGYGDGTVSGFGQGFIGTHSGVWGDNNNHIGVLATSANSSAVAAYSNTTKFPTLFASNAANSSLVFEAIGNDGDCRIDYLGDLACSGNITANAGLLRIDHPLDPANKYLVHASVESPDNKTVYDGVTRLDANGEAWVQLPNYVEALNGDFRYQLTAISVPGPNLYVAEKISGKRFRIAGGTPGGEVSWQVTGIRHDAYAKAHPHIVEEEKRGPTRLLPAPRGSWPRSRKEPDCDAECETARQSAGADCRGGEA